MIGALSDIPGPQHYGRDEARPAASTGLFEGSLVICSVLLIPCVLHAVNLAPVLRVAYPAMNLALGALLFARRSPWFAAHCVLLFCFVSLVRRLVDDQAGFDPASPVLITPYLCCLFLGLAFVEYWARPRPQYLGAFLVLLLAILYGALLAVLQGAVIAAAIDFLKWGAGPLFAVYLLARRDQHSQERQLIEQTLVWAGAFMGLYGVFQYLAPPSWDLRWMQGVAELGMDSIGRPEPYALRVFSTMNSPGSLGAVLSAGILVAFKRPLHIAVPLIICMLAGIALAQYRTIWAATLLGVLLLVLTRPGVFRPANVLAAMAVLAGFAATTLVPQIRETLAQRAGTMTNLRADQSGEVRLNQYRALTRDEGLIVGEGLGQIGVARRLSGMHRVILDSALIEIWRGLGVIAGTAYLGAMACLVVSLFRRAPDVAQHLHFDRAVVVAAWAQLPMGSVHTGENGIFAWLFLGLGLAALSRSASA